MKPLGMSTEINVSQKPPTPPDMKIRVVPANLHDILEQVHEDILYSLYTVSTEIVGTEINVELIVSDLVRHVAGNGVKGYWVGIGIHESVFSEFSEIYTGWGEPIDTELKNPVESPGEQITNGEKYKTFYFNAENAAKYENKGYVVVVRDGVHYHFNIDFSHVEMKIATEVLDPIAWSYTSVHKVKNQYLFGIDLSDSQGNPLPEELFVHYMNAAIDYLSNLLDITIGETEFMAERHDYIRNDYQNWGFIQLQHNPVKEIKGLRLTYGNRPSVEIPLDWIQLDKLTGQITLFPSAGSANSLIIGQTGMLFGFQSQWDYAPQLWEVDYVAGIDEKDPSMPTALLAEAVYKRAACGILNVWGDLIIGAGIANQSVSIDGVSQSIGTTQSAMYGGASARVNEYTNDLNDHLLPVLRQKFGGIRMIVV